MQRFYPFLAYRHDEIDPGLRAERSEGEERIKLLRPLIRIATQSPGLESFLDETSASSFPRMLSPKVERKMDQWEQAELHDNPNGYVQRDSVSPLYRVESERRTQDHER